MFISSALVLAISIVAMLGSTLAGSIVPRCAFMEPALKLCGSPLVSAPRHQTRRSFSDLDQRIEGNQSWRRGSGHTTRLALTTDKVVTRITGENVLNYAGKPSQSLWNQRLYTKDLLSAAGYEPDAFERFFSVRPERLWTRCAQIAVEICRVLLALATDKVTNSSDMAPETIRETIARLGPNFVKVGQALASRPDLVGEAIAGQLLLLQDEMPSFSYEVARDFIREDILSLSVVPPASFYELHESQVIGFPAECGATGGHIRFPQPVENVTDAIRELGDYPEHIFENMPDEPIAAASLGQVYKAWLHGKPVAVKVQRPDLLETAGLDFYLARSIAAVITRVSQESHAFGGRLAIRSDLVAAVDEYGSRLFEELDYRIEAGNMVRFKELYGDIPGVLVPDVLLAYSARRVITSEWVDGEKLVDAHAQVNPADLPLLRVGIDCTLTQMLDKGFLHADPHGGNLLKTADKRLAYLDFGLVSTIPPGVADALICATLHVMNRDYINLAKGFPALALMSEEDLVDDFGPFAAALKNALDPIVTEFRLQLGLDANVARESSTSHERVAFAQVIDRIFVLARSFNFKVPPYFISNVRALGELEGLAMTADPGFSLISAVYPYVCRRMLSNPSLPLRAALQGLVVAQDGSIQWDVLEGLIKDANLLDVRYGPGADTTRSPLDISLEFLLSPEGSFFRSAVLSDITSTAIFSLSRKLLRRPRIRDTERSLRTDVLLRTDDDSRREPSSEGDDARRIEAPTGREASREALTRRLAGGARRRPILALRMCAAVVVASVRAAGLAVVRAIRGTAPGSSLRRS